MLHPGVFDRASRHLFEKFHHDVKTLPGINQAGTSSHWSPKDKYPSAWGSALVAVYNLKDLPREARYFIIWHFWCVSDFFVTQLRCRKGDILRNTYPFDPIECPMAAWGRGDTSMATIWPLCH